MPKLDPELVRYALEKARKHGFGEVEIALGEESFHATLEPKKQRPAAPQAAQESAKPVDDRKPVKSTHVGYFANGGLKKGSAIAKGQVVATITSLGIANDIEASLEGTVDEVLVKEGAPVQYGQVLAWVKP